MLSEKTRLCAVVSTMVMIAFRRARHSPVQHKREDRHLQHFNHHEVSEVSRAAVLSPLPYAATVGNGKYGTFTQLRAAGLISASLAVGSLNGYNYASLTTDRVPGVIEASFKLWATPIEYGVTGRQSFYIGTDGVIRGADKNGARADENDPPVEQ